eukprot:10221327-Ditylum_brightwellii.AAC.1
MKCDGEKRNKHGGHGWYYPMSDHADGHDDDDEVDDYDGWAFHVDNHETDQLHSAWKKQQEDGDNRGYDDNQVVHAHVAHVQEVAVGGQSHPE